MTKAFKRGIRGSKRVQKAKFFFENSDAGKAIQEGIKAGDLIACIRDGYFNIYRNGCSILEYNPMATKNMFLVHEAYFPSDTDLPKERVSKFYVNIRLLEGDDGLASVFVENIVKVPNENLQKYLYDKNTSSASEKERLQVHIQEESPCLVDLEVAFSVQQENEKGIMVNVHKRVDMARLVDTDGKVYLQLVEAKLVTDSRLRAEHIDPEVFQQIHRYEEFLKKEKSDILSSYDIICENYLSDFPYLFLNEQHKSLLKSFRAEKNLKMKPVLLLLANEVEAKKSLNGTKGKNNGDHYMTLQEKCEKEKWGLEVMQG